MNGWIDYMVRQEQHRDQLREVEKQRLIRQVVNCEGSAIGQAIRNLVSGMTQQRPSRYRVPCREPKRMMEKAV